MEADLQRYYHLHLCELGGHRLSWRRFGVLLRHLPPESATARLLRGGDGTTTNELLATVAYAVNVGNWQRGGGKGPKPKPLRLNGEEDPDGQRLGSAVALEDAMQLLTDWSNGATESGSEELR